MFRRARNSGTTFSVGSCEQAINSARLRGVTVSWALRKSKDHSSLSGGGWRGTSIAACRMRTISIVVP